jgi:hypothetical protein
MGETNSPSVAHEEERKITLTLCNAIVRFVIFVCLIQKDIFIDSPLIARGLRYFSTQES